MRGLSGARWRQGIQRKPQSKWKSRFKRGPVQIFHSTLHCWHTPNTYSWSCACKKKSNHMQTTQLLSKCYWVFLLTSWLCVTSWLHTTDLKYQNYSSVYSASVVATCFSWPASYVWYCIQLIVSIKIILQFTQHVLLFFLTSWLCVILHKTDCKYQNYSPA